MGRIIEFPQNGLGKIYNKIDEFHKKYSGVCMNEKDVSCREQYLNHISMLRNLTVSFVITFSIYIIMLLSLAMVLLCSDKGNVNKMFGAGVFLYTTVPLSLLVWWEIERRWQVLSRIRGTVE